MWSYVIAAVPLTALGLWWMRKAYRERGRLTAGAFTALLVMFFVPHLALHDAIDYAIRWTPRAWAGLVLAGVGLGVSVWGIVAFRSVKKVFCFDHGTLTATGPYRWSRNPQYVGWSLFFLSFALMGWTRDCIIALILFAVILHAMVRVEEEHLGRVFGAEYEAFNRRVPRYLGARRALPNAPV